MFGFLKKNQAGSAEAETVQRIKIAYKKNRYGVGPLVEMDNDDRRRLVLGIKEVLEHAKTEKIVPFTGSYADVLASPDKLRLFMVTVEENLEKFQGFIKSKDGSPITTTDDVLSCNVTLKQICQMLVFTAARRQFNGDAKAGAPDRLKLQLLTPYIAFEWQLPLLKPYDYLLSDEHIRILGYELLELRSREDIEIVARFSPEDIGRVRSMIGDDFVDLMAIRPEALGGLETCQPEIYQLFKEVLKERVWDFFARDKYYIKRAISLDERLIRAFRQALADADDDAFNKLARLPVDRAVLLLKGCWDQFGPKVCALFSDVNFINGLFKEVVEYLYMVEGSDEIYAETVRLKLSALQETVEMWLTARE